jgi:hypothetical protein
MYRNALSAFTQFMENREITSPGEMENLKEGLTVAQRNAGHKRKILMDMILNLKPPTVSPAHIYEWREDADRLYEDLGKYMCELDNETYRDLSGRASLLVTIHCWSNLCYSWHHLLLEHFVHGTCHFADAIHSKFLLNLQQCLDCTQRSAEDEMEGLRVSKQEC